jgi:hypothetical protein
MSFCFKTNLFRTGGHCDGYDVAFLPANIIPTLFILTCNSALLRTILSVSDQGSVKSGGRPLRFWTIAAGSGYKQSDHFVY